MATARTTRKRQPAEPVQPESLPPVQGATEQVPDETLRAALARTDEKLAGMYRRLAK